MIYGFHEGNRSEFLATYWLSAFSFICPVSRQSDQFNVDAIAHLARRAGRTIRPFGVAFAVQIKSDESDIVLDTTESINAFYRSQIPFFVLIVDKVSSRIRVYSTLERLANFYVHGNRSVTLRVADAPTEYEQPDEPAPIVIHLGQPILDVHVYPGDREYRDDDRKLWFDVLSSWCELEAKAIGWRALELPFHPRPKYETNTPIDPKRDPNVILFPEHKLEPAFRSLQSLCDCTVQAAHVWTLLESHSDKNARLLHVVGAIEALSQAINAVFDE